MHDAKNGDDWKLEEEHSDASDRTKEETDVWLIQIFIYGF
jgi:hypothetical protein